MSHPSGMTYPYGNILNESKMVFSPIIEQQFKKGQHAFERSQFSDAERSFNNSLIEIERYLRAVALLGRAMCREAQGNEKGAIGDAKRVVEISPGWAGGYLYLSKLFKNQFDTASAREVLRSGVRYAYRDNNLYEVLVFHQKTLEGVVQKRNISIIDNIPLECLVNIFSRLDFHARIQCASVHRLWRRFLLKKFPWMWHNIDLTTSTHHVCHLIPMSQSVYSVKIAGRPDTDEALQILVSKKVQNIKTLEIRDSPIKPTSLFQLLSRNSKTIQSLVLVGTGINPNVLLEFFIYHK